MKAKPIIDNRKVIVCGYVDPPSKGNPTSVDPHAWTSRAIDVLKDAVITKPDLVYDDEFEVVNSKVMGTAWDSKGGLIVALKLPFSEVFWDSGKNGKYGFNLGSFCACLEYTEKLTRKGWAWDNVECTDIILQDSALCNTAGCAIAPGAGGISNLLAKHRRQALKGWRNEQDIKWFDDRPKLTEDELIKIFPKIDFSVNNYLKPLAKQITK